ncbi:aspartic peptidase domain-containing protein [Roridomyces roridus]|uniref:Aspartic peptidase domain-containing protein n=1 Tax=Roridomyces roridus TaxID=1738132 RepID=A0AAD7FP90_9AGAR|nr:aspartic peptidase domain-containing protein [Roridomyces roridus]
MILSATLPLFLLIFTQPLFVAADGSSERRHIYDGGVSNNKNTRYTATVNIGGKSIQATLDTGSTDMWRVTKLMGADSFTDLGVTQEFFYGDGSTTIQGGIVTGAITFGGHTVHQQAFLNVTVVCLPQNKGLDNCKSDGICGLVGLGFPDFPGDISDALTKANKTDAQRVGQPILQNIFEQCPGDGQFFALSFSREGDPQGPTAQLDIGKYNPALESVRDEPKWSVYPKGKKSWNILAKGMSVDGKSIPWVVNQDGAPKGDIIVEVDTGTPGWFLRLEMRDSIYSRIPGAAFAKDSKIGSGGYWRADNDLWVVPCTQPANVTVDFEGRSYPIHPLDLSTVTYQVGPDNVNRTVCVNTLTNGGSMVNGTKDMLVGDSFLRNVYAVYSFGDDNEDPYIQLLSQTNADKANDDFMAVRKQLLANGPPELAPEDLIRLYQTGSSSSDGTKSPGNANDLASNKDLSSSASPSDTSSGGINWGPIVVGLLAANLLVVLILVAVSILNFMRRDQPGRTRSAGPTYAPVRGKDEGLLQADHLELPVQPYSDPYTDH